MGGGSSIASHDFVGYHLSSKLKREGLGSLEPPVTRLSATSNGVDNLIEDGGGGVHLIPRENLNHLLIAALSGDTMKTIQLTAELIGSGAEPQALTSQLASLIKDHLSTAAITTPGSSSTASVKGHPEKLCYALKVLVELEKQPRSFIDQSTQIFAALLQIASPDAPQRTSRRNYIAKDMPLPTGNAIVHLMFRTPEDKMKAQLSEESISRALQSAIGCPVTVNMSIQPIDLTLIEQDADSIPKRHPAECSHSRKQRAPVHQNNIHSTTSGVGRMTHLKGCQVPSPQSGPTELAGYNSLRGERKPFVSAQEKLSISELASSEKQVDISAYQETNGLPPSARTHALRIKNPKHRWLSLSSIPQSDASVEAYSQDILFEHANKDRENKARRDPKLQKHFSKVQEEHHPQVDPRTE
ncbi:hypothetical protein CDL15_Pgr012208 [Punica granatum]|uniref:STICHEL DnaA-N-like alpha-beta domain-containing protein n=1 Tax=Punica granatum TaxID=22663 RepID=A0A218XMF3_PUNGR|nr:hypothetical protein CDL15_Pgr012208 [Punica granatum]